MNLIILNNIEIQVTRKRIKNIHLSVMPPNGIVKISAPIEITDDALIAFASSKLSWIKEQISKFSNQERESKREYVSGESFYLFGKRYLLNINYGKRNNITLTNDRAILEIKNNLTEEQKTNYVSKWYRNQLKNKLSELIKIWSNKIKLFPDSWQIKDMKTKWGSCTKKSKKLWFNLQLAKKPIECIEYVVVHELIHLKHEKHNNDFKSILSTYMPNWQDRKNELNSFILDFIE